MSYLIALLPYLAGIVIAVLLICAIGFHEKAKQMRHGQEMWHRCAMRNLTRAEAEQQAREELGVIARRYIKENVQLHTDINRVRIELWGNPPLDRNGKDIVAVIKELRAAPAELLKVNVATNRQMQRFAQNATDLQQQLQEMQHKYEHAQKEYQRIYGYFYAMVDKKWACIQTREVNQSLPAVFTVFELPAKLEMKTVVKEGINPEEAIEAAIMHGKDESCPA